MVNPDFPVKPKPKPIQPGAGRAGRNAPARKSAKQLAREAQHSLGAEQEKALARRRSKAQAEDAAAAQRVAQVVNLHIAGYSLSQIGLAIGSSAAEVDDMLQRDAARYVRSQPALRVYVRNWISEKYTALLEADWDEAIDKASPVKLENQDRVLRVLAQMSKLHGADAPVQTEVKVEAAPEAVDKMVQALSAAQGLSYDVDVFDVVEAEIVEAVGVDGVVDMSAMHNQSVQVLLDSEDVEGSDEEGS